MAMFHSFRTPSPSSSTNDWMPKRVEYPKPDIDLTERVACVAHIQNDVPYLWPAVIYENYKEFQLHLGDELLTKKDTMHISFRLMHLTQQRQMKTTHVARLLGKSGGVQYLEVERKDIYSYNQHVPELLSAMYDHTIFDIHSQSSLDLYFQFAKALDEAVDMMTTSTTPQDQTLKSWLEIAHQEADSARGASLSLLDPKDMLKSSTETLKKMVAVDETAVLNDHEERMLDSNPKTLQVVQKTNQETFQKFEKASPIKKQVKRGGRPKSQLKTPLNLDKKFQEEKGAKEHNIPEHLKMDMKQHPPAKTTPL